MSHLPADKKKRLHTIAKEIVAKGKGILAADESNASVAKRFSEIKLDNTEENRRLFRQMLFSAKGAEEYLGGVIFFEETFKHMDDSGKLFVELLKERGIKVGIKLDKGLVTIPGTDDEKFTQGFDGLVERCKEFAQKGAVFAKWRCVLKISKKGLPSELAYQEVACTLAKYALICQENGIVPIVEPEVLRDGDHDLQTAQKVTETILSKLYDALTFYGVYLEGTLLKPNMVTAGEACPTKYTPDEVAEATVVALSRTVPCAVPGITFLSGGQSEKSATHHLSLINKKKGQCPWSLTFSFARALQNSAVLKWEGKKENVAEAQKILLKRMAFNSQACTGQYDPAADVGATFEGSLYVKGHEY
ncbi:Fructose-bisphosphate aldolase C [Thelohanellus kitauei]|uniref:Fructose-bisphosphate aldolase n=1 Tax=Thelohanellus kitauei TaxID=669202 RepID=A0A0C2MWS6_THEKT|nr:Fructose-bisphosphate aldolase C [Thelohanellus kitauei]